MSPIPTSNKIIQDYLDSIPNDLQKKDRPFDSSTYQGQQAPFGSRANGMTGDDLFEVPSTEITVNTIKATQKRLKELLKDLDGFQLPSDPKIASATRNGYIFNAYNRLIPKEIQKANEDKSGFTRAMLLHKMAILRIITDNREQSPEDIIVLLDKMYLKQIPTIVERCVSKIMSDPDTSAVLEMNNNPMDRTALMIAEQLGLISSSKELTKKINTLVNLGTEKVNIAIGTDTAKYMELRQSLRIVWSKLSGEIINEIIKSPDAFSFSSIQDMMMMQSRQFDGYNELTKLVKTCALIQKKYESRWFGVKAKVTDGQLPIVLDINNKLATLVALYPQKELDTIRQEMIEYLKQKSEVLASKHSVKSFQSKLVSCINRTLTQLELDADQQTTPKFHKTLSKATLELQKGLEKQSSRVNILGEQIHEQNEKGNHLGPN